MFKYRLIDKHISAFIFILFTTVSAVADEGYAWGNIVQKNIVQGKDCGSYVSSGQIELGWFQDNTWVSNFYNAADGVYGGPVGTLNVVKSNSKYQLLISDEDGNSDRQGAVDDIEALCSMHNVVLTKYTDQTSLNVNKKQTVAKLTDKTVFVGCGYRDSDNKYLCRKGKSSFNVKLTMTSIAPWSPE
jgi:hypothetical protein